MKEFLDNNLPLISGGPVRKEVGGLLRGIFDRPPRTTVYFLFRAAKPLHVSLQLRKTGRTDGRSASRRHRTGSRPGAAQHSPPFIAACCNCGWKQYARVPWMLQPKPDYPPVLDNYLTATLAPAAEPAIARIEADRVGLHWSAQGDRLQPGNRVDPHGDAAGSHFGAEQSGRAGRPVVARAAEPAGIADAGAGGRREGRTDRHASADRMFLRPFPAASPISFGWQDTLAKWGGDAQNLIALRGLDRGMSRHIEKELVLKQTVLLADVGRHGDRRRGHHRNRHVLPRGGLLRNSLHAKNNLGLSASLMQQRQERIKAGGVTEQKVTIDANRFPI